MYIQIDDPMPGKGSDMTGIKITAQYSITKESFSRDLRAELLNFPSTNISGIKETATRTIAVLDSLQNMKKRIIIWLQC